MMTALFAPQYYGSIYYFASLFRCGEAIVDTGLRYNKRFKSVHRCEIADTRGRLALTVPVSKGAGVPMRSWSQVNVSSHGAWWHDHLVSLESAYGRTPYFEFYIDRFRPWLRDINPTITEFDCAITEVLARALGITTQIKYIDLSREPASKIQHSALDMRDNAFTGILDVPYYQVRADRLGFIPGLSALDLLFNMGPESPLVLHAMTNGA